MGNAKISRAGEPDSFFREYIRAFVRRRLDRSRIRRAIDQTYLRLPPDPLTRGRGVTVIGRTKRVSGISFRRARMRIGRWNISPTGYGGRVGPR